jgi:hypothetical protein
MMNPALHLGVQLGLLLQAGIVVSPPSGAIRIRHEARYHLAFPKGTLLGPAFDLATLIRLGTVVTPSLSPLRRIRHLASWDVPLQARCTTPYGDLRRHGIRISLPYGDLQQNRVRIDVGYGDLAVQRRRCASPYWLTEPLAVRHALAWAVTDVDPAGARHALAWSLLADARLQSVANTPVLDWAGQTIRIVSAMLSCDEESPVWIARIEVAELADFAAIVIGDDLRLTLGLEVFGLVVDGKALARELGSVRCELTAVSPLARLDAPFAGTLRRYEAGAIAAATAVADLIGAVHWQLPNWIIPAGRLYLDNVTPLAAARNLVAAIGGIIESRPDGSVVCRRRHPVCIPDYGTATVVHGLFDTEVLAVSAQIAPARGFDRVTVANEEGALAPSDDRIEFVPDTDDPRRGTVHAWLGTSRAVVLTHTGHPATVITALGEVARTETEVVEFIEGRGSTGYPVTTIASTTWQHVDLGSVTANGRDLVADTPGYSLLNLTYITTSLDWQVHLDHEEEVQFVLVDA